MHYYRGKYCHMRARKITKVAVSILAHANPDGMESKGCQSYVKGCLVQITIVCAYCIMLTCQCFTTCNKTTTKHAMYIT